MKDATVAQSTKMIMLVKRGSCGGSSTGVGVAWSISKKPWVSTSVSVVGGVCCCGDAANIVLSMVPSNCGTVPWNAGWVARASNVAPIRKVCEIWNKSGFSQCFSQWEGKKKRVKTQNVLKYVLINYLLWIIMISCGIFFKCLWWWRSGGDVQGQQECCWWWGMCEKWRIKQDKMMQRHWGGVLGGSSRHGTGPCALALTTHLPMILTGKKKKTFFGDHAKKQPRWGNSCTCPPITISSFSHR